MNNENDELGDIELEADLRLYFELHPEARPSSADVPPAKVGAEVSEEQKKREIEERSRNLRNIIENRKLTKTYPKAKNIGPTRRTWLIALSALAACLLVGAFFGSGLFTGSTQQLLAQATAVDTIRRGETGKGIEVGSPKKGFATVVLIGPGGSVEIRPAPMGEQLIVEQGATLVVDVFPELVRDDASEAVKALVFVSPIAGTDDALREFLAEETTPREDVAHAIHDKVFSLGLKWVATNDVELPGE